MWHGGRAGLGRWPGSGGQSRAGERENPGSEVEEVGPAGLQGAAIVRVPAPKLSDVFFPGEGICSSLRPAGVHEARPLLARPVLQRSVAC